MKRLLMSLGLIAATVAQAADWAPQKLLCSFGSEAELALWSLRRSTPPSTFRLGKEATGEAAAELLYPAYTGKGEEWPAITTKTDKLGAVDWTDYRYLRVFVTSPLGAKLPLRVYLKNAAGSIGKEDIALPEGDTSGWFTIDLDKVMPKRDQVVDVHFFMTRPPLDCPFTLRDLMLQGESPTTIAQPLLDRLAKRAEKLADIGKPAAETEAQGRVLQERLAARLLAFRSKPNEATGVPLLATAKEARVWLDSPEQKALLVRAPYLKVAARMDAKASYGYGIASSMSKVLWQDVPFEGEVFGKAELALAGDEEESIQVAVITLRDVQGLRAELVWNRADCPLTSELGWMGHVKTGKASYGTDYQGWWPDPILTFLPQVDVPAERTEALWVTVRAARGTAAGDYQGAIQLSCTDGTGYRVPLTVHVRPFDLPAKRHLPLALSWGEMLRTVYGLPEGKAKDYADAVANGTPLDDIADPEVRRLVDIRQRTAEFLLRKRAEPDMIYRGSPPNLDEVERWIALGMTRFNVLHLRSDVKRNRAILEKVMPEIERRGLLKYAYVYGYDEAKPELFPKVKEVFGDVKRSWPDLQIMTTAYDHSFGLDTGLKDVVDIWVPLTPKYMANYDRLPEARAAGMEVWWYTCCGPRHPYGNWFIEYSAIEARLLMGEQAFFSGTQGYLYYQLSRWVHRVYDDPITKPIDSGPLTDWDPRSYNDYHGDGSVFCPGPDGPLSTIRLENIRDGLEDYEYLWMLRRAVALTGNGQAKPPSDSWAKDSNQCLRAPQELPDFMTKYDRDPAKLLARRERVATLLAAWLKTNELRTPPEE